VGRLVGRKRTDALLEMLARLERNDLRLVVIGSGPERNALEEQAARLGVTSQVTFTGFIPEQRKIDLLAAADIYVSTSQHEGFGLVFLEAMAQGLPIVCYDHGGQTDYLTTGINGAVLPLNDFDGFVQAVSHLVADAPKRRSMSERNRRDVEQYFISNCAALYEALFARLVANTR
jgi:glycosyltransferase involved in cell wall biosynthesis